LTASVLWSPNFTAVGGAGAAKMIEDSLVKVMW
jgi:hypothetical protein